jgi:hypothetical protein
MSRCRRNKAVSSRSLFAARLDRATARRHAQAQWAREIYEKRIAEGVEYIALIGDLNDTPDTRLWRP